MRSVAYGLGRLSKGAQEAPAHPLAVAKSGLPGDLLEPGERIGLINHVVPADQLDEKVYGLARRLAGGAMRSIRWTKQTVNIPLRQLAHSMMDLSLSLETQSNLSRDHQEAVSAFTQKRRPNFTGR